MISSKNLPKGKAGGYLALAITSIVWGTTWVASKIGVAELPALQMAYIRQFLGGLCFVLFFMLYKKLPLPTRKQFVWLLIMSLLMFVMANGLSTWSLQYIPTGLSALVGALYPLSVVIIEMVFFKSRNMTILTFAGLLLGITGIGIVFYENAFQHHPEGFFFGIILSVVAMLAWSVGTIIISRDKIKINPYYGTGWQMLISSGVLFIIAETVQPTVKLQNISATGWWAIIYLVLAGSLLAFVAFIYSMKKLPAAVSSLYAYINPLVAMVTAAIVLNEKLTMYILWGAIVTLVGVFLVNYSIKRSQQKIIAEPEQ
ncbi:MAG TPA: EamA family transporter [Ferruginibacter sp.]|nr:EamA family transporter [Ferruginibacter sp.]